MRVRKPSLKVHFAVGVDEQSHAGCGNSRSLTSAAANSRAASTSACSRYGYSASTSSIERPAASCPTTADTVTRMPLMHGRPPITSGSMVIRPAMPEAYGRGLPARRHTACSVGDHGRSVDSEVVGEGRDREAGTPSRARGQRGGGPSLFTLRSSGGHLGHMGVSCAPRTLPRWRRFPDPHRTRSPSRTLWRVTCPSNPHCPVVARCRR